MPWSSSIRPLLASLLVLVGSASASRDADRLVLTFMVLGRAGSGDC